MKQLLILFASLYFCNFAIAGNATGKISSIYVATDSNAVLFTLTSPIVRSPRCNERERFSINITKPGGLSAYNAILEAKSQGYTVTVEGLNTCISEWKSEDIKNIELH